MKTAASSSNEWIKPGEIQAWQMVLYKKKFNIHWGARQGAVVDSYKLHYDGAMRGLRISMDRMDWLVDASALARIRGEVPTSFRTN